MIRITKITSITGFAGCGKTLILKLLDILLDNPKFAVMDSSKILKWRQGFNDEISRDLKHQQSSQNLGQLTPDTLVIRAVSDWMGMLGKERPNIEHLIIAGFPRTTEQMKFVRGHFEDKPRFVLLDTTPEQALLGIKVRMEIQGQRLDDLDPEAINKRFQEFQEQTVPVLAGHEDMVIRIPRKDRLRVQLLSIVNGMSIPSGVRRKAHNRLRTHNHPIHREILRAEEAYNNAVWKIRNRNHQGASFTSMAQTGSSTTAWREEEHHPTRHLAQV